MSTLDVVAEVLREVAPRALNARQIVEAARGRLPTASRTPETVVSRDLAIEVKRNGAASKLLRASPGEFLLKEALPTALYNEIDNYASAWSRNLIAAGEIAAGVVDERSIRDLKPADVASYRQFHAFSGIGIWSRALRDAGWPDDFNVWSGSCPCQGWSSAGKRRGFADERHLWPDWFRLIAACRPAVIFAEQVASKDGLAWLDAVCDDLEGAGYTCRPFDLPACSIGAPHRRQRLYIVAYARERGREILSAPWLHDRGQCRDDAIGCGTADGRNAGAISNAAVTRRDLSQDTRADRRYAGEGAETIGWRTSGNLEPERGRDDDAPSAVSNAECVVWNEGRIDRAHGRSTVEPDRHGEADGADNSSTGPIGLGNASDARSQGEISGASGWNGLASTSPVDSTSSGTVRLGDAGLARGRRDAGALPRTEGAGEGEWIEAGDLVDELVAPSADDGGLGAEVAMVRGAVDLTEGRSGFRPGDRIRLDGDPSWGGAVRGFWAVDVEWIYCRPEPGHKDGRWRPVVAGTEPLVTRTATDLGRNRAAKLRCYGNAICLPLAAAFIGSVIDCFVEVASKSKALVALPIEPVVVTPPPPIELTPPPSLIEPSWTGPRDGEITPSGLLFGRVPGDRWPYGPPSTHEPACNLFPHRGSPGGLFCDCAASAADTLESGVGA